MAVPVGDIRCDGEIQRDLPKRENRHPRHRGRTISFRRFFQPIGPVEEKLRGPPHHRIRRVLQIQHAGTRPQRAIFTSRLFVRLFPRPNLLRAIGEAHGQPIGIGGLYFRSSEVASGHKLAPQIITILRAHPQNAIDRVHDVSKAGKSALTCRCTQGLAVHIDAWPMIFGQRIPPIDHAVN